MKMSLKRVKMLDEAKQSQGYFFIEEIFIFLVVFIVGVLLDILIIGVPTMKYIFGSEELQIITKEYADGLLTFEQMVDRVTAFTTSSLPNDILILMLFSMAAITIVCMIYCKFFEKRTLGSMGFRKKNAAAEYLVGDVVGAGLFTAAVAICMAAGAVRFEGIQKNISWGTLALLLGGFIVQGMSEEVLCRGYLMISISRRAPLAAAIAVSSVAFACLHLSNSGIASLAFVNLTLFGVFAAVYMLKRGNIWGVCALHSLWNFFQGNFFGLSVSGMGKMDSVLRISQVDSHELMNGGAFGLEGGLAVTIVYTLGIVIMLFTKTKPSELTEEKMAEITEQSA